jgi:hypothetical protein
VYSLRRGAAGCSLPRHPGQKTILTHVSFRHSRVHLPEPFQTLMIEKESPILDFYPEEFHIDMNGKKMLWQGVALLPFIDQQRLLEAMATKYPELTDYEHQRNERGKDVILVGNKHPLFDYLEGLYGKKKAKEPVPIVAKRSKGIAGAVLPDDTLPGTTFDSPLPSMPDIVNDESISAYFFFPPQSTPHRSVLLPGAKPPRSVLSAHDKDSVRRGAGERTEGNGFHSMRNRDQSGPGFAKLDRGPGGGRNTPQGRNSPYQGGAQPGYGSPAGYGAPAGYPGPGPAGRDPYGGYAYGGCTFRTFDRFHRGQCSPLNATLCRQCPAAARTPDALRRLRATDRLPAPAHARLPTSRASSSSARGIPSLPWRSPRAVPSSRPTWIRQLPPAWWRRPIWRLPRWRTAILISEVVQGEIARVAAKRLGEWIVFCEVYLAIYSCCRSDHVPKATRIITKAKVVSSLTSHYR